MTFKVENFCLLGGEGKAKLSYQIWLYKTNDSIDEIVQDNYFLGVKGKLYINDIIIINTNENLKYIKVVSNNIGSGTIKTEDITNEVNISDFIPLPSIEGGSAGVSNEVSRSDHQHPLIQSTTNEKGSIELATEEEAIEGADNEKAITPLTNQKHFEDQQATNENISNGDDVKKYINPKQLKEALVDGLPFWKEEEKYNQYDIVKYLVNGKLTIYYSLNNENKGNIPVDTLNTNWKELIENQKSNGSSHNILDIVESYSYNNDTEELILLDHGRETFEESKSFAELGDIIEYRLNPEIFDYIKDDYFTTMYSWNQKTIMFNWNGDLDICGYRLPIGEFKEYKDTNYDPRDYLCFDKSGGILRAGGANFCGMNIIEYYENLKNNTTNVEKGFPASYLTEYLDEGNDDYKTQFNRFLKHSNGNCTSLGFFFYTGFCLIEEDFDKRVTDKRIICRFDGRKYYYNQEIIKNNIYSIEFATTGFDSNNISDRKIKVFFYLVNENGEEKKIELQTQTTYNLKWATKDDVASGHWIKYAKMLYFLFDVNTNSFYFTIDDVKYTKIDFHNSKFNDYDNCYNINRAIELTKTEANKLVPIDNSINLDNYSLAPDKVKENVNYSYSSRPRITFFNYYKPVGLNFKVPNEIAELYCKIQIMDFTGTFCYQNEMDIYIREWSGIIGRSPDYILEEKDGDKYKRRVSKICFPYYPALPVYKQYLEETKNFVILEEIIYDLEESDYNKQRSIQLGKKQEKNNNDFAFGSVYEKLTKICIK